MEKRKNSRTMEKNTLKEKIHLSIIIPVYNTPLAFVKECLNSIEEAKIRYTYEIIILNDGSTDTELVSFLKKHQDSHTSIIHKRKYRCFFKQKYWFRPGKRRVFTMSGCR